MLRNLLTHQDIIVGKSLFQIRFANIKDTEQIIQNINSVATEGPFLNVKKFVMTEDWSRCLAIGLDRDNRRALLVIKNKNEIIGHCRLFPLSAGDFTFHVGDLGFVILKKFRNIGLGTALLSNALSCASYFDYKKVTMSTFSNNLPTLHLAQKFGFVVEGRRVKQYCIHDRYVDDILLAYFPE